MACCGKGKTPQPAPKRGEDAMTKLNKALAVAEGVEIGINQAMSQAELDKKKTHKPTIQRGPAHPGHKPHGVVKPRQQRGMAHGQRVAKQSFASSPADPKRGELPKPPKITPEHGLGEGWQHSHGSASNRWSHGHAFGAHANRRGSTVKRPKMDECESTLKKASEELAKARTYLSEGEKPPKGTKAEEGPRGGRYYEQRKEIHERARTAQRLQSQRDKIHGDAEKRREKKYPIGEEWRQSVGFVNFRGDRDSTSPGQGGALVRRVKSGDIKVGDYIVWDGMARKVTQVRDEDPGDDFGSRRVFEFSDRGRDPDGPRVDGLSTKKDYPITKILHPDPKWEATEDDEEHDVKKQHPGEYPEEWGPKTLYEKIGEEAAGIEKLIKAGGCPQGQHKHAPYDYCHPSDRKHHGYTDEKPSGPMDAAHGVLDEAIAEARGMGAPKLAELIQSVKEKLDPEGRPEQAAQQLSAVADSYTEAAAQRLKSPNIGIRVQALGLKKVADTLRRAAKKLAAPQAGVEPTNQLAASFDKLIERAAAHDAKGLVAVLRQAQGKVANDPEGVMRSMASLAGVYDRKALQRKRTPDQKLRYHALATLARMAANVIGDTKGPREG